MPAVRHSCAPILAQFALCLLHLQAPCTSPLRSPVSRSALRGTTPLRLTSPRLGRKPTSAVWLLGPRTLLPVSVPRAAMPRLAVAAAAEPPEEPAGVRPRLYGLRTVPDTLREW